MLIKNYLRIAKVTMITSLCSLSFIGNVIYADANILSSSPINPNQAVDDSACLSDIISDKACPKILELSLAPTVKKEQALNEDKNLDNNLNQNLVAKVLQITNKSRRNINSVIGAEYNGVRVNCNRVSIPALTSIISTISCDIPSTVSYTLADVDGRSNKLLISDAASGSCAGKSLGESCAGGVLFKAPTATEPGLVVSSSDNGTDVEWGCFGTAIGPSAQSRTDGVGNTTAIVLGCSDSGIAAKICDDYSVVSDGITFNDWHLPALEEFQDNDSALSAIGGISGGIYWSSSESQGPSTTEAAIYGFAPAVIVGEFSANKNTSSMIDVRCIRSVDN